MFLAFALLQASEASTSGEVDRAMSFNGQHFVIMTVEDPPFVTVRKSAFNLSSPILPPEQWHGWIVDIIAKTAATANFSYELVVPDGDYKNTTSYKLGYQALADPTVMVNGGRTRQVDIFWVRGLLLISHSACLTSLLPCRVWPLWRHRDYQRAS
jgi:hypothetical protein